MRDLELVIGCCFCGCDHSVKVNSIDYLEYEMGVLAQEAFPYLTPTEREQIISGICPKCQDSIFGSEDE